MDRLNINQIEKWADEYCSESGLYLVKVEQAANKITVFADSIDNITIEQCGKLSRYLQSKLEESTDVLNIFTLDVSSPGMSNPLILPIQYKKRIGKKLDIVLEDNQAIEGTVLEADETEIKLEVIIPKNKKTKEEEKIIQTTYQYNQIKKATIPLPTNFKKK